MSALWKKNAPVKPKVWTRQYLRFTPALKF